MKKFDKLVSSIICESTPQLKNLKKDELIDFLDKFIYSIDDLDITEKLAGQRLKIKKEDDTLFVSPKAANLWIEWNKIKFHQDVTELLNNYLKDDIEIEFEVLSKDDIHDYISYDLDKKYVVDFSGKLSKRDQKYLNKNRNNIHFLTKDDIKITHSKGIKTIQNMYERKWKKQIESIKTLKELRSLVIPELQKYLGDYIANEFGSVINRENAIEGFFVTNKDKGFKIPNSQFADLQRINVKPINIMKMPVRKVKNRLQNLDDQLVKDLVQFLESNIELEVNEKQYKRLIGVKDSKRILDKFNKSQDAVEMYTEIKNLIK